MSDTITTPAKKAGIVSDMPAAVYHADPCVEPSLNSSIIRRLCNDSPAHAWTDHPRLNPEAQADADERAEIGTAAHALLLEGNDAAVVLVEANDWRTKAAQDQRAAARAAGRIPLLAKHWAECRAMVQTVRAQLDEHTDGGADMFRLGAPEQVLIWQEGDVWCRARLDYLRDMGRIGWAIDDLKTTAGSANPDHWSRQLFLNGADIQCAWYRRGFKALTGLEATFRFCVIETYKPYALSVLALGPAALVLAEKKCLYGLEQWRACRAADHWPSYPRRTCYAALTEQHENWWLAKELEGEA